MSRRTCAKLGEEKASGLKCPEARLNYVKQALARGWRKVPGKLLLYALLQPIEDERASILRPIDVGEMRLGCIFVPHPVGAKIETGYGRKVSL